MSEPNGSLNCTIADEFALHRQETKEAMAALEQNLLKLSEHTRHLPVIARQNEVSNIELRGLREDLVKQISKLIESQSGRVSEGYIPLETYKEHIKAYKDTCQFFAKIIGAVGISIFGISKLGPELLQMVFR